MPLQQLVTTRPLLDRRYRVTQLLAIGGMGQTYLAEDTKRPGNPLCVVKQLKSHSPQILEKARELFARESNILEKLGEHPQIPRLLAYFEDNGEFYLVQEYIEGKTLAQEFYSQQVWSETQVINLLSQLLEILDFVHDRGVIHRDIKPTNIILRKKDNKLVLIDFGAVKEITTQMVNLEGLTSVTVAIGTLGYMPSEQSQSRPKFASDIYSLGMMAIFALTGIAPNQISKNPQTEEIIWRDLTEVGDALGNFIDQMVKYNFQERYPSAIEAKQALQEILPQSNTVEAVTNLIVKKSIRTKLIATGIVLLSSLAGGGYYYLDRSRNTSVLPLTYENIDYGIQMKYPDNWKLEKIEDPFGNIVRFYPQKSQAKTVRVTIEVEKIELNTSVDEYTTSTIGKIIKYLPEAKIISSQPITLGTKAAHQIIYTGKNLDNNLTNKYLQIWLLETERAYLLSYFAPEEKYQDFIETVEQIMIPSLAIGKVVN